MYRDVILPESVETAIQRIRAEMDQPPLKDYARKMLAEIGERAAVEVLEKVLSAGTIRKSFSGFVSHLVTEKYPTQAASVLSPFQSPTAQNVRSPSSNSPRKLNGESLRSPVSNGSVNSTSRSPMSSASVNSTPSHSHRTSPQNVSCRLSFDDESQVKRSPNVTHQSSHIGENKTGASMTISQQLMILGQLEHKKLFLVLSYMGRKRFEDVVTIEDSNKIIGFKDCPMRDFEPEMWNTYGQKNEADRCRHLDWDSGKTHFYYCYFSPDGSYYFKGPYLNSSRTHLQRSLGDDNVLIVKFSEHGEYDIDSIIEEGIIVGLRRFRFFVFKAEHKKGKKNQKQEEETFHPSVGCYFVHLDSVFPCAYDERYILYKKTVSEARRRFMHVHTLSSVQKYMTRFSLILSKTINLGVDFPAVVIERIEDIPFKDANGTIILGEEGKPILHTDGTGYISEDLAMKCPKDFTRAKYLTDNKFEKRNESVELEDTNERVETRNKDPPLLMQCRLFHNGKAIKGTLLVNKKLPPGRIQIRPSMLKVKRDRNLPVEETFNALEIVNVSCRPGRNSLSKNLIALLSYGGVPPEFFLNLLMNALEETRRMYSDRRAALRVACNNETLRHGFEAERMISCGLPLEEPYLQHCLSKLEPFERAKLREGKIPISESFYLMGTADPTGVLNNDQVCVILDNGQISGKVLVYRNPGLHFGDVHVMEAVYLEELEEVVGNAKYGIFFSTKGCRSAAYEIATGDFDGDLYWVSRNPELLEYYKASDPWTCIYTTPGSQTRCLQDFSDSELERELFRLFLEARKPSYNMAAASDSWLSYMDRLLTLGDNRGSEKQSLKYKIIKLIDIYYDALDAPKTGKKVKVPDELKANLFPHHMERASQVSYHSTSVLGQIYETVLAFKNQAVPRTEIWKLPFIDAPLPNIYDIWTKHYENYRREMSNACKITDDSKNEVINDVFKTYKQLLYNAPEFEESAKNSEMIYEEAVAIYHIVYDYAMRNGIEKCCFAWTVAGSALFDLCAWKLAGPKEKPIVILPSVLRDLLRS